MQSKGNLFSLIWWRFSEDHKQWNEWNFMKGTVSDLSTDYRKCSFKVYILVKVLILTYWCM